MRDRARFLSLGLLALALVPPGDLRAEDAGRSSRRIRIEDVVKTLASPEFAGRRGPESRLTIELLVRRFRAYGLAPLFGESYEQSIAGREAGTVVGRNVGGWLQGSDPELADEWIIVAAHFDHLGARGGVLYPGADDNASGVAMMLEVAGELAHGRRPRRSVAFVGFDREEDGLWGSRYFVENPPRPLESMRLLLVADMLGRSLGGVCDEFVFVLGSEHVPSLRPGIAAAAEGLPIRAGVVNSDVLLFDRSDYGPFRLREIPYLFFTTGESPAYHSPEDRAETIDYVKLEAACELVGRIAREAVEVGELARWQETPAPEVDEARVIRDVLARLQENAETLKLKPLQRVWLTTQLRDLDAAIARGVLTLEERRRMVTNVQLVLYTIL